MPFPTIEKLSSEGVEIYCERRGNGPILLLIHGAMEDAGFYSSAVEILADEFTVVTYDRRCNSRSSGDQSAEMVVAQQAQDAAFIIKSIGDGKAAAVVGRSGGAVISLELATIRPELVDFLIVHEAPVIKLLPDSDVQATKALAARVGCENIEFPGHHDVPFWMPEEFADATRRTIRQNKHSIAH
jgi:pimeloyl-ACP methyl ester carboxylesterase